MSTAPLGLPEGLTHVVVLGHEMDRELVRSYPSALAGAATGREYSHEAAIVMQLAAYIRNLGYQAVASMNDTGLVIPMAVQAGLGEYARNQLVITPEFGPRLRFSKIFTDMPLDADRPKRPVSQNFATYVPNVRMPARSKHCRSDHPNLAAADLPSKASKNGHLMQKNASLFGRN